MTAKHQSAVTCVIVIPNVTKACPSMKGAKPTAELCGYAVPGLGFYYIPFSGNQKAKIDLTEAIVKVSDGSLTVQQVTVELKKLMKTPLPQLFHLVLS